MTTITILSSAILVSQCCAFSLGALKVKTGKKSLVTFYKVPLVCSAAPNIGCGSKAKPVLKQLEQISYVAEAWLNHEGSVIAVVRKENANTYILEENATIIFTEQNMDVQKVSGKDYDKLLNDFKKRQNWLRPGDVDKLSMIEAGEIAARLAARVNVKTPLSSKISSSLKSDFEDIFKKTFINLDVTNINKQSEAATNIILQSTRDKLLAIGKKYLNETQQDALEESLASGLSTVEGEKDYEKEGCCSKSREIPQKVGSD